MTSFEDELRKALARHEPPGDFTARVLANANRVTTVKERLFAVRRWHWRFVAVATLLVALVAGLAYRQHVRAVQGQAAKQQLLTAMHIAGKQLHEAQLRVKRIQFPEMVMQ